MKDDIKKVLNEFHLNGTWPKGSNSSFIALIPKVDSPQSLNEFILISLINKIVSKLLAKRIKVIFWKL